MNMRCSGADRKVAGGHIGGDAIVGKNTNVKKRLDVGETAEKWLAKNRSLVLRQTPVWGQSLMAVLLCLGGISITAASIIKIDEVISVEGVLVASKGSTEVKSASGGLIQEVKKVDGDLVNKGDTLIVFDTREARSESTSLERQIELEINNRNNQIKLYEDRKSIIESKLKTARKITESMEELVKIGGIQRIQYLQQLDALLELDKSYQSIGVEVENMLVQSKKIEADLRNRKNISDFRLMNKTLKSPVTGIVFDSSASEAGVIPAGNTIMKIVPQDSLAANLNIPNKDIGSIRVGQEAKIRVDAYPFTRFGELEGTVESIGADVLLPDEKANYYRFPVKVNLTKETLKGQSGIEVGLRSGMSVTGNIRIRDKRVISLLSDMLAGQADSLRQIKQ